MDSIPTLARNSQAENIVADRAAPKIPGHMHLTQSQRSAATASDGLNSASYFSTRHLLERGSQTISGDVRVLEQGRGYTAEIKALGPAVGGTSRVIRIMVSFHVPNAAQWYPLAYEVESPIPIVLDAEKYSQRQSQARKVSRHGNEQTQVGTSRNSERQNHHYGRFSPSQPGPTLRLLDKY